MDMTVKDKAWGDAAFNNKQRLIQRKYEEKLKQQIVSAVDRHMQSSKKTSVAGSGCSGPLSTCNSYGSP